MKTKLCRLAAFLFISLLLVSCVSEEATGSLKKGNSILEFKITTQSLLIDAEIDEQTGLITKRIPAFIDLSNLNVALILSEGASISPDPATITDYSSPVTFTVKSQSGAKKVYQVKLAHMDINKVESCSEANASKWFGGDNRTNVPDLLPYDRNIGTGQSVILAKDLVPSTFSVHLSEGFRYFDTYADYNQAVTLKLIIKDGNGATLASTTTAVSGQFTGGFVPFDLQPLHLFLEANKTYVFYWYLVDGAALGVTTGSSGNTNSGSGFCFNTGYWGESYVSTNTSLEQQSAWYQHEWHFNIELEGKE